MNQNLEPIHYKPIKHNWRKPLRMKNDIGKQAKFYNNNWIRKIK